MNRILAALLLLELLAAPAAAQTVRADRVTLNAGPCVITSGSAAPNGARVGNICDTFIQTTTGAIWTKTSGTGTSSGWIATLAGTGTPGTLAVWTSAGAIGDSIVSQAAGLLTVAGSATITGTGTMAAAAVTGTATIGTAAITGNATIGGTAGITGNTTLGGWIGTASYASQVTGWRITSAGAADVRYLFTDELRAKLFTADAESVLAGSMRVTKSYSTVAQPFTCPAASSTAPLWVFDASTYGDAPVFQTGGASPDWVVIHVLARAAFGPFSITECAGTVASYVDGTGANAGQQQWTFTRGAGSNGGAMTGGTVVPVNQLVQDLGVSGNGYVGLSAVDGANGVNAPYLQTNTWTGAPLGGNITTQCRLGNLTGITAAANEFGLLCGGMGINAPSVRLSTAAFYLRNLPLSIFDGANEAVRIDATAPSLAIGNPLPASYTGGNTGLWIGKDPGDSVYKLRIGNPTGNRLTWNGAILSIVGEGSGITNINGGNIQAGTITASQINVTPAGAALNDDPYTSSAGAWADNAGLTPALITAIADGVVGSSSLRSQAGHSASMGTVKATPIDAHKTYRVHAWARASGGATGWFSLGANLFTAAGYLTTLLPINQVYPGTVWTEYTATLAGIPTTATAIAPTLQLNGIAGNAPVGTMETQDVRIEEVLPSTLIKDGAITTAKIQAGAITANEIAANTITVANLNASGFGDNLIKNSTFEGPTAGAALAGWSTDPAINNGTAVYTCCGIRGPGTLLLQASGGAGFVTEEYLAVPVQAGQTYRLSASLYTPTAGTGFYFRILESSSTAAAVRYVRFDTTALGPGDVASTSLTDVCANCAVAVGWHQVERTYTVPSSGVAWVSVSLWNYSCPSGTCLPFYFDAVEMQPQIGAGHILAASITADRLVAHSITAAQILGGTITGTEIAGRTITAGNLVANTITSNEIGVRAIVAGNIATGTLTANEIAGNTITANKLNVSTLSAITANLGAVTAGSLNAITITGSTITGTTVAAGCATMDSNGITLTAGAAACNWYKFSNGGVGMYSDGGAWFYVQGSNVQIMGTGSGAYMNLIADATLVGPNSVVLNSNNNQIHLTNNGYVQFAVSSLSNTAQGFHACLDSNSYLVRCQ